jgi:hypothetical protein
MGRLFRNEAARIAMVLAVGMLGTAYAFAKALF